MSSVQTSRSNDYRVFERLKKDSEDVDIALDQFMKEREAALNLQLHAKNDYENDMKRLDESDLLIDYEKMLRNTVDHNLMRHLNVAVEGTGNSAVADEYGDNAFEDEEMEELQEETVPGEVRANVYVEAKRPMPSFEEKAALREQLFAFLDEARLNELNIVSFMAFFGIDIFLLFHCLILFPSPYFLLIRLLVGHATYGAEGSN